MKSIYYAIHGLVSSLLLNVGLTGLAEKLDPTVQLTDHALRNTKASAFSEFPCQFKASAFSEFPCQFKASAFSEFPCQFKASAFSEFPCQFSAQSAS